MLPGLLAIAEKFILSARNAYIIAERFLLTYAINHVIFNSLHPTLTAGPPRCSMRDELLGSSNGLATLLLEQQLRLRPEDRVQFEVDYISLADSENLQELHEIDSAKVAVLSGAVRRLPVAATQKGEVWGSREDP